MSKMANPMEALRKFQQHLNVTQIDPNDLDDGYLKLRDQVPSGKRYSYVKIVDGEARALAIFGEEDPYRGVERFSVGYAVSENHRRLGLAVEVDKRGIEELKKEVSRSNKNSFYVEALIDVTNTNSIGVAKKIFPGTGTPNEDDETGTPALLFWLFAYFWGRKSSFLGTILFRVPATCRSGFLVGDILHRVNHMLFAG